MPNGLYRSAEEWALLESPLLALDPAIEVFATAHGLETVRNYHGWPSRTLRWVKDGVNRQIEVRLDDEARLTLTVAAAAWDDREDRYWRYEPLREHTNPADLVPDFSAVLDFAITRANSWSADDLLSA